MLPNAVPLIVGPWLLDTGGLLTGGTDVGGTTAGGLTVERPVAGALWLCPEPPQADKNPAAANIRNPANFTVRVFKVATSGSV